MIFYILTIFILIYEHLFLFNLNTAKYIFNYFIIYYFYIIFCFINIINIYNVLFNSLQIMKNEQEINNQKEILKSLDIELDKFDKKVDELIKTKDLEDSIRKCSPKKRAEVYWTAAFGIYTNKYLELLLNEKDPELHPIKKEIKRLNDFRKKLINADKTEENNEIQPNREEKKEEIKDNNEKELNNKIIEKNNENKINERNEIKNIKINEEDDVSEDEEQLYADNVFLSSSPLPCVTVYISQKRIFRTYTINGEFVSEEKEKEEQGTIIKSPIIFKNLYFQDFLIYGTDKGYVKIRAFPKMNIIGSIHVSLGNSIETLEISKDKRYCYAWSKGNEINIIKDSTVSSIQVSENISRMGFNIGN